MDCQELENRIAKDPELKEQMDEFREQAHVIIGGSRHDIDSMNLTDIASKLNDEYDTEGDQVAQQIEEFLKMCQERGL